MQAGNRPADLKIQAALPCWGQAALGADLLWNRPPGQQASTKGKDYEKKTEAKTPTYHAYTVRDAKEEGQKGFWTRIGAFFAHGDGEGGTLLL
ncbi:hypothetical protein [Mesorhizobium sp. M0435]|uniref:hypothetical protein n=1 Tax=Mesorhizobium sp. M0435 TaxID=2956944 RepID=UPI0033352B87